VTAEEGMMFGQGCATGEQHLTRNEEILTVERTVSDGCKSRNQSFLALI